MAFLIDTTQTALSSTAGILVFQAGQLVLAAENSLIHPADSFVAEQENAAYVGEFHGRPVWTLETKTEVKASEFVALRAAFLNADDDEFAMLARASQLLRWRDDHRFCGRCGSQTHKVEGDTSLRCESCGFQSYPRISPCIIVLVRKGDQALLGRAPHFPAGRYSTLAGFIEAGETAEQAVAREVFEETAIKVKNIRYVDSQPWPFPHSLMLGFEAEYAGGDIRCQPEEIEDAQWFSVHDLPEMPPSISIARRLIDRWLNEVS